MSNTWLQALSQAESMIPLLGKLGREQAVKVQLAGRTLMADSVTSLMSVFESYPELDLGQVYQALEQLVVAQVTNTTIELEVLLAEDDLQNMMASQATSQGETPVVLYGFGRIGPFAGAPYVLIRAHYSRYEVGCDCRA